MEKGFGGGRAVKDSNNRFMAEVGKLKDTAVAIVLYFANAWHKSTQSDL